MNFDDDVVTREPIQTWSTLGSVAIGTGNASFVSAPAVARPKGPSDRDYAFVWIYMAPFVLLIGLVGNSLTLFVMSRPRFSGTSTSVYLSAMAVADTLALICRIPAEFFEACDLFVLSELNRWTCKLEKFSIYATSDAAIWILVVFTLDRLVAVCSPLLKHAVCTPRRAFLVTSCVVVLAVVKNVHVFWTRDVDYDPKTGRVKRICGRPEPYRYFENEVRPWLALTLVTIMPFVVIVTSNALIVKKLLHAHRVRTRSLSMQKRSFPSPQVADDSGHNRKRSCDGDVEGGGRRSAATTSISKAVVGKSAVFNQTSLMCLTVSLAFLVCVTPSIVLTIGRERWKTRTAYYVARAVSHQLSCINHAINVFLYCVTGQRFRDELLRLVHRCHGGSSTFDESTRRYYMTRRSTQTSTSAL